MDTDGWGQVVVEAERSADETVVYFSDPMLAFSTKEGFKRSARTLRWLDASTVSFIAFEGLHKHNDGSVILPITDDAEKLPPSTILETYDLAVGDELPKVTIDELPVPGTVSRIRVIGGGPANDVNQNYLSALHVALHQLSETRWKEWWRHADLNLVEITYEFDAEAAGISIRRTKNKVIAKILRPVATTNEAQEEPVVLAYQDVTDLMIALGSRMGIGPPPRLDPSPPSVT